MFHQNADAIYAPRNRIVWYALAFQGGFVNILGFLAVHRFVSHVTGFAGRFAFSLYEVKYTDALAAFFIPVFFLIGSTVSGFFTEVRREKGQAPIYIISMISMSLVFATLGILGVNGSLGIFGEPFESFHDFILLAALSFTCGMQNALFTSASGAVVRTTHLTGITTDLGIGIAKILNRQGHDIEYQSNWLRIGIIVSFLIGSLIGVVIIQQIKYLSFFIPAVLSLIIAFKLYHTRKEIESKKL